MKVIHALEKPSARDPGFALLFGPMTLPRKVTHRLPYILCTVFSLHGVLSYRRSLLTSEHTLDALRQIVHRKGLGNHFHSGLQKITARRRFGITRHEKRL